jgi:hypothetical protein
MTLRASLGPLGALPFALIIGTAACSSGEGTAPTGRSALILTGDQAVDTVEARLTRALAVEIRGDDGRPLAGTAVRFEALPSPDTARPSATAITMAPASGASAYSTLLPSATGPDGRASVLLRLGHVAGLVGIRVSHPESGLVDTAFYTVRPGNPVRIDIKVRDTAISIGRHFEPGASTTDRFANRRSDALTLTTSTPTCAVDVDGRINALAVGRCAVAVRGASLLDTVRASVIPQATVLIARSVVSGSVVTGHLISVGLDGSNPQALAPLSSYSSQSTATPDGSLIIYTTAGRLTRLGSGGASTRMIASSPFTQEASPRLTRDAAWVYFTGVNGSAARAYRIRPDGTQLQPLAPTAAIVQARPDPSPDGRHVVMHEDDRIVVLDVATGTISDLGVRGYAARWSPSGDRIAYVSRTDLRLRTIQPDGRGDRLVSPSVNAFLDVDWTSDGAWLVAAGMLVRVTDGMAVRLGAIGFLDYLTVIR